MTQDNLTQWDPASHGVAEIVAALDLQPHPEGGWYRETFRSALKVRRADGAQRDAFTQILFLLGPGEISRWHRVNHADELVLSRWRSLGASDAGVWAGGAPGVAPAARVSPEPRRPGGCLAGGSGVGTLESDDLRGGPWF